MDFINISSVFCCCCLGCVVIVRFFKQFFKIKFVLFLKNIFKTKFWTMEFLQPKKKKKRGQWEDRMKKRETLILLSNRACSWPFSSIHNFPLDLYYPGVKLDTFFLRKKQHRNRKGKKKHNYVLQHVAEKSVSKNKAELL